MFLGLGHGFGFNQQRAALSQLTALIQSLNGHIFAPGLETYADQATLNPAASALDSQVGYVGSASTQGLGENFVTNSEMVGATSSTLPPEWTTSLSANGVTATQTGKGTDAEGTYIQLAFSGTAGPTQANITIQPNGTSTSQRNPAAFPGQVWTSAVKLKGVSGTQRDAISYLSEVAGTSWVAGGGVVYTVTNSVVTNCANTRRITNVATTSIYGTLQFTVPANSGTWDQVIRIYAPQLERGHPTSYTPTYGTAISRGVFASAAQGTLANTPKLVTLGNARGLEFDGSTDHLVTDITTPSSGYMLSVFRQVARTTESAMIGSVVNSSQGKGFYFYTDSAGYLRFRRSNGVTTVASISPNPVPLGQLLIADCAFNPTLADVRLNGSAAGTNTQTADPGGGTAITLIGASNNVSGGAITPFYYFPGSLGIQIIIPNVTLPASTEQRIRKLVGQIYGVQTQ